MQRVRLLIPRMIDYPADTAFELFGDLGSGAIDYDHPLPPGQVRLWPEAPPRAGHLEEGHLIARHLDSVRVDGHLEGVHLTAEHLDPVLAVAVVSPRYVFGRFKHALRMIDSAGNASPNSVVDTRTINTAPDAPRGLRRTGWDGGNASVKFTFDPVRFNAVPGG